MSFTLGVRDRTASGQRPTNAIGQFQQQGTVDWTRLAFASVSSSISILSRVSLANVDPYTIFASQVVAGDLAWSEEGRERFDAALRSSQGIPGYHKALWFGFGVKHIIDVLTSTEQGARCAALCACLSECYTVSYASGVMAEMVKASKFPLDTTPSLQQWRALVDSCAGILAASPFGIRAEFFMHFDGEPYVATDHGPPYGRRSRGVASRDAIAEALLGLIQLSQGKLQQMTIIGRADVGFIVAIAEWLIGLEVIITDGNTGETMFTNCTGQQEPRLIAVYERSETKNALYCRGKTYRLPDASSLIMNSRESQEAAILSGRVPWQKALELVFGSDFRRLMRIAHSCARAIGSAAAAFSFLVQSDSDIPFKWRQDCQIRFPESYGSAYVHFAQTLFPELETLNDGMRSAVHLPTFGAAKREYEIQIASIAMACNCSRCCPLPQSTHDLRRGSGAYCLIALLETIIIIVRSLSGIMSDISPMRAGLEAMYDMHVRKLIPFEQPSDLSPIQRIIENGISEVIDDPLLNIAETIYGGRRHLAYRHPSHFISAIAENGLCYFLDILREPGRAAATVGRVNVIAGRIEHLGRPYHKIQDGGHPDPAFAGKRDHGIPCIFPEDLKTIGRCTNSTVDLLVQETLSADHIPYLSAEYGVNVDNSIIGTFGPGRTVQSLSRNEGLVACSRDGACNHGFLELRSDSINGLIQRAKHAAAAGHYSAIDSDGTSLHIFTLVYDSGYIRTKSKTFTINLADGKPISRPPRRKGSIFDLALWGRFWMWRAKRFA